MTTTIKINKEIKENKNIQMFSIAIIRICDT